MVYNFEDLAIWQLARLLSVDIYAEFQNNNDFGFRDQIQRAVVSIMNNIAEGFQKHKNSKDNKQFIYFLNISSGSCGEVKSMLYLAEDLGYLSHETAKNLREQCISVEIKISALLKILSSNHRETTIAKQPSQSEKRKTTNEI